MKTLNKNLNNIVSSIRSIIDPVLNELLNGKDLGYDKYNKAEGKYTTKKFSMEAHKTFRRVFSKLNTETINSLLEKVIKEFLKISYNKKGDYSIDRVSAYNIIAGRLHIYQIEIQAMKNTNLKDQLEVIKNSSTKGYEFSVLVTSFVIRAMLIKKVIFRDKVTGSDNKQTIIFKLNNNIVNKIKLTKVDKLLGSKSIKGFKEEPTTVTNNYKSIRKHLYTGHYYKYTPVQDNKFIDLINTLNQQQYYLVNSIWNQEVLTNSIAKEVVKFNKEKGLSELKDKAKALESVNDEIEHIKELGSLYINWSYGPDNGRIYCMSGNLGFQKGWINHLFELEPRVVSYRGVKHIEQVYNSYKEEWEQDKTNIRKAVKYLAIKDGYEKAIKGEPTGVLVEIDQKASGSQMQGLALRSKAVFEFTGALLDHLSEDYNKANAKDLYKFMIDGLKVLIDNEPLDLSKVKDIRTLVKKAYNPFQYGSGAKAMSNDVRDELIRQGLLREPTRKEKDNMDLYPHIVTIDIDSWFSKLKEIDPRLVELRKLLLDICSIIDTKYLEYVSPDGFNCCITALNKKSKETQFKQLFDTPVDIFINEVEPEHMGVRLVGAFSHHLDSTILRMSLIEAFKQGIKVIPVHDAFLLHPNDIDKFNVIYYSIENKLIKEELLFNFLTQVLNNKYIKNQYKGIIDEEYIEELVINLTNDIDYNFNIKGGLFID